MARRAVVDISGLATIDNVLSEFQLSLRAAGRSERTVQSYLEAAEQFATFLRESGHPGELRRIRPQDIDKWTVRLRAIRSPTTVAIRYRSLQAFFKWAVSSGELSKSPMIGTARPAVQAREIDFPTEEEFKKLLKAVEIPERTFEDWRDSAILRLFYDTGCRLSEITGLKLRLSEDDDRRPDSGVLDLERNLILVLGKGNRFRQVTFGTRTRTALRKYLDARSMHELAASDWLWLGSRGKPLSQSGIAQLLRRRCTQAGIRQLHPHMFRHARAHDALSRGMSSEDAMTFFGWKSRDMLTRYGSKLAEERALESARRLGSPGDRL